MAIDKSQERSEILRRAHLVAHKSPIPHKPGDKSDVLPQPDVGSSAASGSIGKSEIGPYSIVTRRTTSSCSIKVDETLGDGRQITLGHWSGDPDTCENRRREVADIIHSVRAEKRMEASDLPPTPHVGTPAKPHVVMTSTGDKFIPVSTTSQFFVTTKSQHLTKHPASLSAARDLAQQVSFVQGREIEVRNEEGVIEETYVRGTRTFTRQLPAPVGRQFKAPEPKKPRDLKAQILSAIERGDVPTISKLTKELAEG